MLCEIYDKDDDDDGKFDFTTKRVWFYINIGCGLCVGYYMYLYYKQRRGQCQCENFIEVNFLKTFTKLIKIFYEIDFPVNYLMQDFVLNLVFVYIRVLVQG